MKLDEKGVAMVSVAVIVLVAAGGAVAVPVAVDAVDVDPDHPLYALERLGERIRMVSVEDQMKERWSEYSYLVDRAKGLEYKHVLEEFVQKMHEVVPGDVAAKQDIVRWLQENMPGIGLVQLKLQKELAERLREGFTDLPEIREEIENEIDEIENMEEILPGATPELRENITAHLRLIKEKLVNIARRYPERVRPVNVYFDIDNVLVDVDITVNVEVKINVIRPPDWTTGFENALDEFENLLLEVQAMLQGTPENAPGRHAAERLVEVAIELRDKAVAAYGENRTRNALGLIHAAKMHLLNAKIILEHASEWESKFRDEWTRWKRRWKNFVKPILENRGEQIENLIEEVWESVPENWEENENMGQEWQEKWQGTGEEVTSKGTLQKLEATIWMYGTHVLVGEENGGVLYALRSDTVNLDAYIGRLVQVEGTKIHSGIDFGPPYLNVEGITTLETSEGPENVPAQ
ncbi:MAG: hypothetical protein ACE5OT_02525 [Candidatus Hadarchaeaceae archaeon]